MQPTKVTLYCNSVTYKNIIEKNLSSVKKRKQAILMEVEKLSRSMPEADKLAFTQLVKEHERIINKVCRVYTRNESDRQDLFQEILYQLWRSFGNFRGESKPSTFIYKVALNTACTQLRNDDRRQRNMAQYQKEDNAPDGENTDEQIQRLHWAISQLDDAEKAIITLYLENHSTEEIAEIIGISTSNAGVKIHRIKKKLQTIYSHEQ
jgi:RNA polymerase sigma-70 factor (ECF subfamily)